MAARGRCPRVCGPGRVTGGPVPLKGSAMSIDATSTGSNAHSTLRRAHEFSPQHLHLGPTRTRLHLAFHDHKSFLLK